MSELISGREAAKILGISGVTVSEWVARGKLQLTGTVSGGRTFLFDRAYIEALAAERKQVEQPVAAAAA